MERVAKGWAGGSGEQGLENWNGEHRKKEGASHPKWAWDHRKSFSDDQWAQKSVSQTQLTRYAASHPFPMAAPWRVPTAVHSTW